MAASAAGRELMYFTFGDAGLSTTLETLHQLIRDERVSVGMLYDATVSYFTKVVMKRFGDGQPSLTLFQYLLLIFAREEAPLPMLAL
ncbi:hypothetical protein SeMB42_g02557 [Synchytrium endobioticum]|nr:hypothetical protein SeMB42_g02557 [Synchytrium endobioticum]